MFDIGVDLMLEGAKARLAGGPPADLSNTAAPVPAAKRGGRAPRR